MPAPISALAQLVCDRRQYNCVVIQKSKHNKKKNRENEREDHTHCVFALVRERGTPNRRAKSLTSNGAPCCDHHREKVPLADEDAERADRTCPVFGDTRVLEESE